MAAVGSSKLIFEIIYCRVFAVLFAVFSADSDIIIFRKAFAQSVNPLLMRFLNAEESGIYSLIIEMTRGILFSMQCSPLP
ncbi:MAG: hypothetical protein IKS39_02795 [Clostridia bacterium]|nr:hypothetical protein [Clostridia bacterium]